MGDQNGAIWSVLQCAHFCINLRAQRKRETDTHKCHALSAHRSYALRTHSHHHHHHWRRRRAILAYTTRFYDQFKYTFVLLHIHHCCCTYMQHPLHSNHQMCLSKHTQQVSTSTKHNIMGLKIETFHVLDVCGTISNEN